MFSGVRHEDVFNIIFAYYDDSVYVNGNGNWSNGN